jgi:hypothetical protein
VYSPWVSGVISIRANSSTAGINAEMVAVYIANPEAFTPELISLIPRTTIAYEGEDERQYQATRPQSEADAVLFLGMFPEIITDFHLAKLRRIS